MLVPTQLLRVLLAVSFAFLLIVGSPRTAHANFPGQVSDQTPCGFYNEVRWIPSNAQAGTFEKVSIPDLNDSTKLWTGTVTVTRIVTPKVDGWKVVVEVRHGPINDIANRCHDTDESSGGMLPIEIIVDRNADQGTLFIPTRTQLVVDHPQIKQIGKPLPKPHRDQFRVSVRFQGLNSESQIRISGCHMDNMVPPEVIVEGVSQADIPEAIRERFQGFDLLIRVRVRNSKEATLKTFRVLISDNATVTVPDQESIIAPTLPPPNPDMRFQIVREGLTLPIPPPIPPAAGVSQVFIGVNKNQPRKPSRVEIQGIDTLGRCNTRDPIITTVEVGNRTSAWQTFTGIPQEESKITIRNGTLGLRNLMVWVNTKQFLFIMLRPGEERRLDVAAWMWPGSRNTITLIGAGPPGASAQVVISDLDSP